MKAFYLQSVLISFIFVWQVFAEIYYFFEKGFAGPFIIFLVTKGKTAVAKLSFLPQIIVLTIVILKTLGLLRNLQSIKSLTHVNIKDSSIAFFGVYSISQISGFFLF